MFNYIIHSLRSASRGHNPSSVVAYLLSLSLSFSCRCLFRCLIIRIIIRCKSAGAQTGAQVSAQTSGMFRQQCFPLAPFRIMQFQVIFFVLLRVDVQGARILCLKGEHKNSRQVQQCFVRMCAATPASLNFMHRISKAAFGCQCCGNLCDQRRDAI